MAVEQIIIPASPEVVAGWQSHFKEGVTEDKDALTATELADLAGISPRAMQARLKKGVRLGQYTIHRVSRVDSYGRRQIVPAYKLVKKKRSRKRGR